MGGTGPLLVVLGFVIIFKVHGQSSSSLRINQVAGPYYLSEGPHWDVQNQVLYFVDIFKQTLHCLDPATNKITGTYIKNGPVGVAVPVAGKKNTFIAGSGTDLVEIKWNPKTNNSNPLIKLLAHVDAGKPHMRFNDGKVDPMGRFWAGTMNQHGPTILPDQGSLYRFESCRNPVRMINSTTISNGLVWSHDNKTFYWIDTPTLNIYGYDYDNNSGNISNKRIVFNFSEHNVPGKPDGMTMDKAGNLWVACYNGGRVIQVDPVAGKLLQHVELPVKEITSVAFGGRNLDVLYVTSARENLDASQLKEQPMAGSVFTIHGLGTVGTPMRSFKV